MHLPRESSATIFPDLNEIFLKVNTYWIISYTSQVVLMYFFSTFVLINALTPLTQSKASVFLCLFCTFRYLE